MGTVAVNFPKTPVTKGSNGISAATLPNVCKFPGPPAPFVPAPLPNIGMSNKSPSGFTKDVTSNGDAVCIKGATFASTGDEPSPLKGLISGSTGGITEFIGPGSMNVKFEGKNVQLLGDMTTNNAPPAGGGGGGGVASAISATPKSVKASAAKKKTEEKAKCPYCKKKQHEFADTFGDSVGNGTTLARRIFEGKKTSHAWWIGAHSLQAHHLICSEAFDDEEWPQLCEKFGYDVNRKHNGVMLPNSMALACQLFAPLHRGSHGQGEADHLPYPRRVKELAEKLKEQAMAGDYCSDPGALVTALDNLSKTILAKVDLFQYTITRDGHDYDTLGNGCGGTKSVTDKPQRPCPTKRNHSLKQSDTDAIVGRKRSPLKTGA